MPKSSAVSRRVFLRTAALSPLALATAQARAAEATAAVPTDPEPLCDAAVLSQAVGMLWQQFFAGAGREVDPECFTKAHELYYRNLCWNLACWADDEKRNRALDCAFKAGKQADANAGLFGNIHVDEFEAACKTIQNQYQEACERLGLEEPTGIACG